MSIDYDRSSSTQLEHISFDGRDDENVVDFLRSVKRVALAEEQQRNDHWLIDYTESCLGSPALEWFLNLDEDALGSWKSLQKAFLGRFKLTSSRLPPSAPAASVPQTAPAASRPIMIAPPDPAPPLPTSMDRSSSKYLIIGDSGVGKSCLLTRYMSQYWVPNMAPTMGIQYQTLLRFDGDHHSQWQQHFWDASGSDAYHELREEYYKGISVVWLVYDVTNRESFESESNDFYIRLIGNKVDLHDRRVVSMKEAYALAQELNLAFGETSAKTNQGVQVALGSWGPVSKRLNDV
ncbi:Ras- protein Rab-2-B [Tulasnella sp. 330]|nr:Ras- protein Rab-2-B [Tulasnella sp. 330]KAG8873723.1 Ras- protein Rab-2-B [Tulasnella sp. 331]